MAIINSEKYSLYYQKIEMIYQRPEVKASLEIILSVFTVGLLIFAAIRPTLTNITSLQKKIADLEAMSKKADNKITQIFNAQKQLETYQNQIRLFDIAVPDGFSVFTIAGRIEVLAKKKGLQVQTMEIPGARIFGEGKAEGDWAEKILTADANKLMKSGVTFTVAGSPTAVKEFLVDIENMDKLSVLNNVVFMTETGVSKNQVLRATGEVYFYVYKGI